LGFSGLRGFGSRISVFLGGYRRSPKTQPFHIVKRWSSLLSALAVKTPFSLKSMDLYSLGLTPIWRIE